MPHHPKRFGCTSSAERAVEAVLYEKAFANKNGGGDGPCLDFSHDVVYSPLEMVVSSSSYQHQTTATPAAEDNLPKELAATPEEVPRAKPVLNVHSGSTREVPSRHEKQRP